MALPLVGLISAGLALYDVEQQTGIVGWGDLVGQMARLVPKIAAKAHHAHSNALPEMIDLARSRVPQDTGLLLNGIGGHADGDMVEFTASAVRTGSHSSEDYAHFVEFGTAAGVHGSSADIIARDGLFSLSGAETSAFSVSVRKRRQYRTHPGSEAQPFFYNSVNEVLAKVNGHMAEIPGQAGAEEGFETQ